MPLSQFLRGAIRAARIRPGPGPAIAHSAGLLVLIFSLNTGCRTPWGIEPLPVDQLEVGMDRDAVWRVLGDPEWTESIDEPQFPSPLPGSDTATGAQLYTAWGYEDERVDPLGLFFAGLFLPVYAPVYLASLAFPVDDSERDCVWTDQRWIDLYFEDDRLTEWIVTPQPEFGWCDNSGGYYSTWTSYWGPYPWTYARYYHHGEHYRWHHDDGDHHDDGHHEDGDHSGPGHHGGPGHRGDPGNRDDSGEQDDTAEHANRDAHRRTGEHRVTGEHRDLGSREVSGSHRGSTSSRGIGSSRSSNAGSSGRSSAASSRGGGNSRGADRPSRPDR
jgi:hypothetical protein